MQNMCSISTNKQPNKNSHANMQLVNSENWSLYGSVTICIYIIDNSKTAMNS